MNNPNVSIDDLFAHAQESFNKYLSKQERHKPSQTTSNGSLSDSSPLDRIGRGRYGDNEEEETSPSPVVTSAEVLNSDAHAGLRDGAESPRGCEPSSSIGGRSSASAPSERRRVVVSASEMRRREAVAASLRATCDRLRRERRRNDDVRPLSWREPSFRVPSSTTPDAEGGDDDDGARRAEPRECESSSSSVLRPGGKRKECGGGAVDATDDATGVAYPGLNTIMPRAYSDGDYNPCYRRRRHTQEEVAGLVDFAEKWIITPGMKRRRTT